MTWPPRLPLILALWVLPQQLSSCLRETFLLNPHVWETLPIVTPEWFSLYWGGVILLAVLSNSRLLFSLEKIKHTPHVHTFYAWWGQSVTLRSMCAGKKKCKYLGGRSAAWFYALKYWLGPNCLQMVFFCICSASYFLTNRILKVRGTPSFVRSVRICQAPVWRALLGAGDSELHRPDLEVLTAGWGTCKGQWGGWGQ